jgi:hypothetical protein
MCTSILYVTSWSACCSIIMLLSVAILQSNSSPMYLRDSVTNNCLTIMHHCDDSDLQTLKESAESDARHEISQLVKPMAQVCSITLCVFITSE